MDASSRDKRTDYKLRRSRDIHNLRRHIWSSCVDLLINPLGFEASRAEQIVLFLLKQNGRIVKPRTLQQARHLRLEKDPFFSQGPIAETRYLQKAAEAPDDSMNPGVTPEFQTWTTVVLAAWDRVRSSTETEPPFSVWISDDETMRFTAQQIAWLRELASSARSLVEALDHVVLPPRRPRGRPRVRTNLPHHLATLMDL